jgi:hypothetical protein
MRYKATDCRKAVRQKRIDETKGTGGEDKRGFEGASQTRLKKPTNH